MAKRRFSTFLMLLLFLGSLSLPLWAAGTLNLSSSSASAGDTLTVSGTSAANSWVSLKLLDSHAMIVYFNMVESNAAGQYNCSFKVPSDSSGVLKLVAGCGGNVSSAELAVSGQNPAPSHTVSIVASPAAGGAVSGGGAYNDGTPVTVTAIANSGYSFVNWTEGGIQVSTSATYTFTMGTANRNLTANFTSTSGNGGNSASSTSGSVLPTPGSLGATTVLPSAGGTLKLEGGTELKIPAGALSGSSGIIIEMTEIKTPPPAPSGFSFAGKAYRLTVGGAEHYRFNRPVAISFSFDQASLPSGSSPQAAYYDEAQKQWVMLGGTVAGSTITVNVDHFTKFAVISKAPDEAKPFFKDIQGHWAEQNILQLLSRGITGGYPDGSFQPDQSISRAEFTVLLVKAFKLEATNGPAFPDTINYWGRECIATAAGSGIVKGYSSDRFGPQDLITREQMAVMLVKAAQLAELSGESSFIDNAMIARWAKGSALSAVRAGIIKGYPDNSFRPQGNATRAEAATVILKAISGNEES